MRQKKLLPFALGLLATLLFSCAKDRIIQHKCAGVWSIEEMEQTYYSNNSVDSTILVKDLGVLVLEDNDLDLSYLDFYINPNLKSIPVFTYLFQVSNSVGWELDNHEMARLSFVGITDVQDYTFVYDLVKRKKNRMELQYVRVYSDGSISFREKLYLTRNP